MAAEKRALSVYEDELVRYRARVQTLRVKRDRARARRRWWTWLKLSLGILAHRRSRVGTVRDPAVLIGTSAADLLALIGAAPGGQLGSGPRVEIRALIERDHDFRGQRRHAGGRPPGGRRR